MQESTVFTDEERQHTNQDSARQDEREGGAEHEPGRSGGIQPGTQGSPQRPVFTCRVAEFARRTKGGPGPHMLGQEQAEEKDAASYRD